MQMFGREAQSARIRRAGFHYQESVGVSTRLNDRGHRRTRMKRKRNAAVAIRRCAGRRDDTRRKVAGDLFEATKIRRHEGDRMPRCT